MLLPHGLHLQLLSRHPSMMYPRYCALLSPRWPFCGFAVRTHAFWSSSKTWPRWWWWSCQVDDDINEVGGSISYVWSENDIHEVLEHSWHSMQSEGKNPVLPVPQCNSDGSLGPIGGGQEDLPISLKGPASRWTGFSPAARWARPTPTWDICQSLRPHWASRSHCIDVCCHLALEPPQWGWTGACGVLNDAILEHLWHFCLDSLMTDFWYSIGSLPDYISWRGPDVVLNQLGPPGLLGEDL